MSNWELPTTAFGAISQPPGASGSLYPTSGSFSELIFNLWELPGAYFQPPGASGSLYSTSRSFWELIFNLRELLGAYIQPPGASGSLYSISWSFRELILNLQELLGLCGSPWSNKHTFQLSLREAQAIKLVLLSEPTL